MSYTDLDKRHPATKQIMLWFRYEHLPAGQPRHVSDMCAAMAEELLRSLEDGPELTTGLRKLLEAKDCLVRQAIADSQVVAEAMTK